MVRPFDELVARTTSKEVIQRGKQLARVYMAEMLLCELRKLHGVSQKELAKKLGIRQPSLSKLEAQDDMQVSTLKRLVEALGGKLIVKVEFPDGALQLKQFDKPVRRRRRASPRKAA